MYQSTESWVNTVLKDTYDGRRDHFSYSGELDLGGTWGWCWATNRDADALTRSNYEVISEDLLKRFPRQVQTENYSHWLCGWVERICIQLKTKKGGITQAAEAAFDWYQKLEDYPVANEEHFSQTEQDECIEIIENCYGWEMRSDRPNNWAHNVYYEMSQDNSPIPDYMPEKDIYAAAAKLGYMAYAECAVCKTKFQSRKDFDWQDAYEIVDERDPRFDELWTRVQEYTGIRRYEKDATPLPGFVGTKTPAPVFETEDGTPILLVAGRKDKKCLCPVCCQSFLMEYE